MAQQYVNPFVGRTCILESCKSQNKLWILGINLSQSKCGIQWLSYEFKQEQLWLIRTTLLYYEKALTDTKWISMNEQQIMKSNSSIYTRVNPNLYKKAKPNRLANGFRTGLWPRSVLQSNTYQSNNKESLNHKIRAQQSPPWFSAFCYLFSISAWVADYGILSSLHGNFNNLPHVTISPFMNWK